ncbi:hypothetical protein PHISP_06971 [Aspergillus sp. HF37]|nr:hypothetical protein PHISP_06971 [Aspergillus sp. HF37]
MQPDNRKNKPQAQHEYNNRIDFEAGALVRIKLEHRPRRAAGARRPRRAGSHIAQRLLVVSGGAAAQRGTRSAGRSRRRGSVH